MSEIRLPGFVDMHVHFREPGFSYKETILTGSRAAAAGGFTTVCTMPNLDPVPDSLPNLRRQLDLIEKDSSVQVIPFASITQGRRGDFLVDYAALTPYVAGFSDDGSGVQSEEVMLRAMEAIASTGKILAAHCEVNSLLNGGYVHDSELLRRRGHRGISSESEWQEIERDIRLAEKTGCRLHICHVSTKEGVDLIRSAKKKGIDVTAETAPHYLAFCDEDILEEGRFKMNPPLRCCDDRDALRQGLADGTIDVVATDHAPHAANEKNRGLEFSAMGVVGLETAFAAVYTVMVRNGLMSMERLVEVMADAPRRILGLPQYEDDFVIVDPDEAFTVDPTLFKSAGRATPFEGMTLWGTVKRTYRNGKLIYERGKV